MTSAEQAPPRPASSRSSCLSERVRTLESCIRRHRASREPRRFGGGDRRRQREHGRVASSRRKARARVVRAAPGATAQRCGRASRRREAYIVIATATTATISPPRPFSSASGPGTTRTGESFPGGIAPGCNCVLHRYFGTLLSFLARLLRRSGRRVLPACADELRASIA